MKIICLYAGFNRKQRIEDYVVYYLKELSRFADIYYYAANEINNNELEKINNYVISAWGTYHKEYDFGSWKKIIFKIGFNKLLEYDVLILANDSCFGPIYDIKLLFESMNGKFDFWGITSNFGVFPHIQSYFLVIDKSIFKNQFFQNFFEHIEEQANKDEVCVSYEIGLSRLIMKNGFSWGTFISRDMTNKIDLYKDITRFQNTLINNQVPFIKKKVFLDPNFAEEDTDITKSILNKINYNINLTRFDITADLNIDRNKKYYKKDRIFLYDIFKNIFYMPIKKRIISKIDYIYENITSMKNDIKIIKEKIDDKERE